MKLTDLDAQFIGDATATGYTRLDTDTLHGAQGVLFQCPKCAEGKERGEEDGRRFVRGAHYVRVYFANPDGAPVAPPGGRQEPAMGSVRYDARPISRCRRVSTSTYPATDGGCRWHGFVRNGDAA